MSALDKMWEELSEKTRKHWCEVLQSPVGQEMLKEIRALTPSVEKISQKLEELVKKGEEGKVSGLTFRTLLARMSADRLDAELKELLKWAKRCVTPK